MNKRKSEDFIEWIERIEVGCPSTFLERALVAIMLYGFIVIGIALVALALVALLFICAWIWVKVGWWVFVTIPFVAFGALYIIHSRKFKND